MYKPYHVYNEHQTLKFNRGVFNIFLFFLPITITLKDRREITLNGTSKL